MKGGRRRQGHVVSKWSALLPNNCAIQETTGDGVSVGRCFYHLKDQQHQGWPSKICPRHGDVTAAQAAYIKNGTITTDAELRASRVKGATK